MPYTWDDFFAEEKNKAYFINLENKINEEYLNYTVYPPASLRFNAFKTTPFNEVKVVILGQDPYHNKGEANGLAFSVSKGIKLPPSLKNIFKEIENEFNEEMDENGDLTYLAKQGVLLMNTLLTVRENAPMSHKGLGYELLSKNIIKKLNEDDNPKVFLLWGGPASAYEKFITNSHHLVLKSAHPSPLSSYRGFFNNQHFIKTNEFLISHHLTPINWINSDKLKLF